MITTISSPLKQNQLGQNMYSSKKFPEDKSIDRTLHSNALLITQTVIMNWLCPRDATI